MKASKAETPLTEDPEGATSCNAVEMPYSAQPGQGPIQTLRQPGRKLELCSMDKLISILIEKASTAPRRPYATICINSDSGKYKNMTIKIKLIAVWWLEDCEQQLA